MLFAADFSFGYNAEKIEPASLGVLVDYEPGGKISRYGQTHYQRVDEVDHLEMIVSGEVWSFETKTGGVVRSGWEQIPEN